MKTSTPSTRSIRSIRSIRVGCAALVSLVLAGSWSALRSQETPPERAPEIRDKNVMKFKLHYAQGALEAIATENFSLLATNAQNRGRA